MNRAGLLVFLKITGVFLLIFFLLWALSQFGVIDLKTMVLQSAGYLPGLEDLAENYELGRKRSVLLSFREKDLQEREKKLKQDQDKLSAERDRFENEKFQWEKEHPTTTPNRFVTSPGNAFGKLKNQEEAKVQEYLNMVGNMKPKQAALVIQKLPEETVFMIFDQLRPSQVTKIMENLPGDYLAKLTQDRLNKYRNP